MRDKKGTLDPLNLEPEDIERAKRIINKALVAYGTNNFDSAHAKKAVFEGLREEYPRFRDKKDHELINHVRMIGANLFMILGIEEPKTAKKYKETIENITQRAVENSQKH